MAMVTDTRLLRLGVPKRSRPRLLARQDYPAALAFCHSLGADGVMAGHRLAQAISAPVSSGEVWALEHPGARPAGQRLRSEHLRALMWAAGSLMPVGADSTTATAFLPMVRDRGNRYASMVGDAAAVAALWARLAPAWPPPRAYRQAQPLMAIGGPGEGAADPLVKPATPDMLDRIVPACRAMFTEELGFPPPGPPEAYRAHVANQIGRGALLARLEPSTGEVVFKAELGADCGRWVQVQGVWTNPAYRGRGIAKAGMVAVIAHARACGRDRVCLYVNDFNAPALAVYRAVGFTQVGTWATVLL
ncbi:MAG: GNAT family N-acetyltransferase [Bifidobacteriaceae bacterium]|jgi:GNAT superfamily N-acetyltransferase|nr:GNAT family N-acetyltransferase [Bifidobacteriaceae bacterium]